MNKTFLTTILFISSLVIFSCNKDNNSASTPPIGKVTTDTIMKNVPYGTDSKQKMDIYLPKGRNNSTKVIVLIHGGGWYAGDKTEMEVIIPQLQKEWPETAIVNINYRLANGSNIIHNAIMDDITNALTYIKNEHSTLSISTDFGLIGASAGAQLSLLYAYKHNVNGSVKAVANFFGPSYFADWSYYNSFNIGLGSNVKDLYIKYAGTPWDKDLYESLSPYHIVTSSNYIPTISFHGTADIIVPVYQSQWFKAKLNEIGVASEYTEYEGQGHGFSDYTDAIQKTVKFFKMHL
jgi:acetyl esterase/lipase